MYKVFIENTPVHICQNVQDINSNAIIIHHDSIKDIRSRIFNWAENDKSNCPIFLIHPEPQTAFEQLFAKHEFIEAAGGIVRRKNKFLFIKRNGVWDIPKGKLDKGENIEQCAVREIEEECGIKGPKITEAICTTFHTYYYKGKPTLKKTYWFALQYDGKSKLEPEKQEGITKAKWLSREKVNLRLLESYGSITEVLESFWSKVPDEAES